MDVEANLLRAAILPVKFCTSFIFLGGLMSSIVLIFSRFASIPLSETMKPRNLPYPMPKTQLAKLNFILYFRRAAKTSHKPSTWLLGSLLITSKSYTQTSILHLTRALNTLLTSLQYAVLSLFQQGHHLIAIQAPIRDEEGFLLITLTHPDLIIIRVCVHEA